MLLTCSSKGNNADSVDNCLFVHSSLRFIEQAILVLNIKTSITLSD